jgi:hypothetical protein
MFKFSEAGPQRRSDAQPNPCRAYLSDSRKGGLSLSTRVRDMRFINGGNEQKREELRSLVESGRESGSTNDNGRRGGAHRGGVCQAALAPYDGDISGYFS